MDFLYLVMYEKLIKYTKKSSVCAICYCRFYLVNIRNMLVENHLI